ncbi:rhodanese-like domain-containing protein [Sorangium sp. So ce1014]|uniref:rhodanese-like domain-containing protein n=1 Tax=Sorangium sp. So ce1014 TaxID=3133326 RepID=UPI003F5D84F0
MPSRPSSHAGGEGALDEPRGGSLGVDGFRKPSRGWCSTRATPRRSRRATCPARLDEHFEKIQPALPRHGRIELVCSVGHRAGLATSILRRRGFSDVVNVLGGMTAWEKLDLPKKKGPERTVTTVDIEGARR